MKNMLFSILDLSMMFYSIRLTKRSQSFLCFHSLTDDSIWQFTRLFMGLKTAPFVATRSLQMVLNQKNFITFVETIKDKNLKETFKQLKLENLSICYIDDLLLASPKSLGVQVHLKLFEFVMEMMCLYGFKVNKSKCNILCDTATFLGIELSSQGCNGVPLKDEIYWPQSALPEVLLNCFAVYASSVTAPTISHSLANWWLL